MSEEDFNASYYHPADQQTVSLYDAAGMYVWHSKHHLAHITELIKRNQWNGIKGVNACLEEELSVRHVYLYGGIVFYIAKYALLEIRYSNSLGSERTIEELEQLIPGGTWISIFSSSLA
ncbi:hypothetical protein BsIDN1_15630 [Bacillus safensis]|uniref:Uncharacterized protein n=1 Tax=Bacillus safensis TaxID=561879 RepID=A0A5S9M561_BACIA|nr:hypothetical protein BsIDN1_15630 [Bacillus safensis]